ncbi:MAG: zinc-ribbon domain-containing protein [Ruminococcus sp.]|jgi:hypothetical protein
MFCSKCGTQLPDDAMFCSECGAPTRNYKKQHQETACEQMPYQQQYYEQPAGQNYVPEAGPVSVKEKFTGGSRRGIIMALAIIVIAVLAGLLYVMVLKPRTPQDTVDRLEKAVEDLDIDEILNCFDETTRQAYKDGMEEYGDMSDSVTGLLGVAGGLGIGPDVTIRIRDIDYQGADSCTVSVDFKMSFMGESQEDSMDLPMKKEGRDWVIDGTVSGAVMGEVFG